VTLTLTDIRQLPPEAHLTLNGRNIPFVNDVKYLGVIFDTMITWRLHIEMIKGLKNIYWSMLPIQPICNIAIEIIIDLFISLRMIE
jgi:hypothetical protein